MAIRTDPKNGFKYGWVPGDNGYGEAMNFNMELLMLLIHLTAISDLLTAPPGGENIGDTYIPASVATGLWTGQEGNIAVWWQTPAQATPEWLFIPVKTGYTAWIQSGGGAQKSYNGAAWVLV